MKDFLVFFNQACKDKFNERDTNGNRVYNFPHNIEQIPAEGMAPKLADADRILFGNDYDIPPLYANQFVSLWENATIYEKMDRDGELGKLLSGGGIVHINVDSKITYEQAIRIMAYALRAGCAHFAINAVYSHCTECNETTKGNFKTCPHCNSEKMEHYTRIIGYLSKVESWGKRRREYDYPNREFITSEELNKSL
jgi:ribonucleoside-triphosphate reductase